MELLLTADDIGSSGSNPNPFDSWAKLQVIVNRAKTEKNIIWAFHAVSHDFVNNNSSLGLWGAQHQ